MKNRKGRNLRKYFLQLFFLYLFLIPAVFAILDRKLIQRYFEKNAVLLIFCFLGAAFLIAISLRLWSRHEKRLHRW